MANRRTPQVTIVLPWILAAVFLLLYLATLNHWISLNSLSQPPYASNSVAEVARVSGWMWQPSLMEPLYWLITYPVKWFPERSIPLALNLLSAIFATVTLWLLARSVAILPHNRTEAQRSRERDPQALLSIPLAWVPPAIAVVVCGLQLSFWEHATVASGEMFKLLLFAYVIRCFLEYRLDERPVWLYKATFVFAAGMTNSWGMIGYAPLFLVALVWVRRLEFFNLTFLSRVAIFALAGLLFYLVLPIVAAATSGPDVSFWHALRYNLGTQKGLLFAVTFNKYSLFLGDRPLWVLGVPALLPLLFMSVRWPSYFGDQSKLGVSMATLIFHFFHGFLFVVCLWVMLDPQFSPRGLVSGTPLLSIYYLCSLAIAYFSGYFLLVFGVKPGKRARSGLPSIPAVNVTVRAVVLAILVATPVAMVYRNLPIINANNGALGSKKKAITRQFAEAAATALPAEGGVILSDDVRRLTLVRSVLTARNVQDKFLFIDTRSLKWPDYHRFLEAKHPAKWKNYVPEGARGEIDPASLVQVLFLAAQTNAVYYLHPSFGYFFEAFWAEPQGAVYRLNAYSTNSLLAPALSRQTVDYNQEFWTRADQNAVGDIFKIKDGEKRHGSGTFADRLLAKAKLKKQQNPDAKVLAGLYSLARNTWGIQVQKARGYKEGEQHFERALDLNEDNIVARINLAWSRHAQSGGKVPADLPEDASDLLENYRSWDQLMNEHGAFDEPRFCFERGRLYVRANLVRQAAHQFKRVHELQPGNLSSRLWLAQLYVMTGFPDEALAAVNEVQSRSGPGGTTNVLELMSVHASALLSKNEPEKAERVVQTAIKQNPQDQALLVVGTQILMNFGRYSNAVALLDRQLQKNPENVSVLINKGFAYLQLNQFEQALPVLDKALTLETNRNSEFYSSALFNRAIANLQSGRLDAAREDYERLKQTFPTAFKVHFGLAEVAYRKRDTNSAIHNYQLYLENAPTNTHEAQLVRDRLQELQGGSL